jgi:hypothetical protein
MATILDIDMTGSPGRLLAAADIHGAVASGFDWPDLATTPLRYKYGFSGLTG